MTQAATRCRENNRSSQGKAEEHAGDYNTSHSPRLEGRGLLESVVCRHWRGSAQTPAGWVLWNALPPRDLCSTDPRAWSSIEAAPQLPGAAGPASLFTAPKTPESLPINFTSPRSVAEFVETTSCTFRPSRMFF